MKAPITLFLIITCTLLFFLGLNPEPFFYHPEAGWRLITPIFFHSNIFHLVLNITWLFFFGSLVEQKIGSFRYILLILVVALV